MFSMSQKSSFIVAVLILEKEISVLLNLMVHYKLKQQQQQTTRELLCKWPPTKHPVSYFFLVKMRWIERKKKYTQEWMRASILTSRVPFHALPHLRRWAHTDQYSIYSRLSLCQTKVAKALEKMDTVSGPTGLKSGNACRILSCRDGLVGSLYMALTSGSKSRPLHSRGPA